MNRTTEIKCFLAAFLLFCISAVCPASNHNIVSLKRGFNPLKLDKTRTWWAANRTEVNLRIPQYGKVLYGLPDRQKEVAITFDDGPHPQFTPKYIALLKKLHVPATFFLVGKMVDQFPYLAKLEVDNGFEVGNHSYSHACMTQMSLLDSMTELKAANMAIYRACGKWPLYFRPPGGDADPRTVREAAANGLIVTMWSDDPGDYDCSNYRLIVEKTLRKLSDGGIILLHDGGPATYKALPYIIKAVRERGYRFVPLHDLIVSHDN